MPEPPSIFFENRRANYLLAGISLGFMIPILPTLIAYSYFTQADTANKQKYKKLDVTACIVVSPICMTALSIKALVGVINPLYLSSTPAYQKKPESQT